MLDVQYQPGTVDNFLSTIFLSHPGRNSIVNWILGASESPRKERDNDRRGKLRAVPERHGELEWPGKECEWHGMLRSREEVPQNAWSRLTRWIPKEVPQLLNLLTIPGTPRFDPNLLILDWKSKEL